MGGNGGARSGWWGDRWHCGKLFSEGISLNRLKTKAGLSIFYFLNAFLNFKNFSINVNKYGLIKSKSLKCMFKLAGYLVNEQGLFLNQNVPDFSQI